MEGGGVTRDVGEGKTGVERRRLGGLPPLLLRAVGCGGILFFSLPPAFGPFNHDYQLLLI